MKVQFVKADQSEARLQALIGANGPESRNKWAHSYKTNGKKVVGIIDHYIPEEIIEASGMLPFFVSGTWSSVTPHAAVYRPANTCGYCSHVLESILSGDVNFLDALIGTDWDDDTRRLVDVLQALGKPLFAPLVHVPHQADERAYRFFARVLRKDVVEKIEEIGGMRITDSALRSAVDLHNEMRSLLRQVYEFRKREVPPLSGKEYLGLTTAAMVMPKRSFVEELRSLMAYIEIRKCNVSNKRPRILVTSDRLDNPAYFDLIEKAGCLIAMDDLDTGSRYLWKKVELDYSDPVYSLAKGYLNGLPCPRMFHWDKQVQQVIAWVKEFRIDGIINLPQIYSYPRVLLAPYFSEALRKEGIPETTVTRDYHLSSAGQIRTRVQAFLEMLS
jgi:benzoyl-CoA reductase/2-hydroxyglutaryl-CoA dehydratase subunit BcrC/BadD/HgdB